MSKNEIKFPKVFISYAWSTKEYKAKVMSFANDLVNDGIDVLIDEWSMKEGNDIYTFMEQSVNDPTVTNVLMLLDPQYAKKANSRQGGVGTETQIISAEIYNNTKQDKFLPVIFERDANGNIHKPAYLKNLLHFDLTIMDSYDEEYRKLVRTLYGKEIHSKPKLGKRPKWLESESEITTKTRMSYDIFKSNLSNRIKTEKYEVFLSEIKDKIISFCRDEKRGVMTNDEYLTLYTETTPIKNDYLELVKYVSYIEDGEKIIASKMEEICAEAHAANNFISQIKRTLLHELFIYTIAIYYKLRNYSAISYTLNKTYFVQEFYNGKADNFNIFYNNDHRIDNAICKRDNVNYYSGTAQYWIETINVDACSKQDFIFADELCYNASVLKINQIDKRFWFPLVYAYDGYENKTMRNFANKLKSLEHLSVAVKIFGYENVDEFKKRFIEIENQYKNGMIKPVRFSGCFEDAPLICYYVKSEELGIYR